MSTVRRMYHPVRDFMRRCCRTVLVLLLIHSTVESQTGCPPADSQTKGWPSGSTVTFSLSGFTTDEQNAVKDAFAAWTNTTTDKRVTFQFTTDTNASQIIVVPGQASGHPGNTAFTNDPSGFATNASIVVDINNAAAPAGQKVFDKSLPNYLAALGKVVMHEVGHSMGEGDEPISSTPGATCGGQTAGNTIMNGMCGTNDSANNLPTAPTQCDKNTIAAVVAGGGGGGGGGGGCEPYCMYECYSDSDCFGWEGDWFAQCIGGMCQHSLCSNGVTQEYCESYGEAFLGPPDCLCTEGSPIIIDLQGDGYRLTDATDGVLFDLFAIGHAVPTAWTRAGSDEAFLVLDRNGDGAINDGSELFGSVTPQSAIGERNGFVALAEFDKPESGGNSDGVIDARDTIYRYLRLWLDDNHNGVSEREELFTLPERKVFSISLAYRETRRRDRYGNMFRYAARVDEGISSPVAPWAYDVVFAPLETKENNQRSLLRPNRSRGNFDQPPGSAVPSACVLDVIVTRSPMNWLTRTGVSWRRLPKP